jgi:hypothetical protein
VKTINWAAAIAATPCRVTCTHCGRDEIVVNRQTGLRIPHYLEPRTKAGRKAKRGRTLCEGSNQAYDNTPAGTT